MATARKPRTLPQRSRKLTPQNLYPFSYFDLMGLDMYNPDDMANPARCVYGRNFRLFAPNDTQRRVAISKRNGHSFYSVPIGETVDQQITSTTGAADQTLTTVNWVAQKFTAGATGPLTRVDIRLKNSNSGTAPVIVALYSDSSGPGTLLATTSVPAASITGSYAYITARFIEAPAVTSTTAYWIVAYNQANGTNNYLWSSSTSASTAMTSADSGTTWASASFEMNLKTYVATTGSVLGMTRFYTSTASPLQLFAFGTNVYKINDGTGATTSIKSGLSSSATNYQFTTVNNKCYFVNGYDAPQVYNGSSTSVVGGSPPTASDVVIHANHLFLLQPGTNYAVFSSIAAYETFPVTNFIYFPSPTTADPAIKMISIAGMMYIFTRNTKWLLSGTDLNSFVLKESPANLGAVSPTAITSSQGSVYFMSGDYHIYSFNGAKDTKLSSERVAAVLRNVASTSDIHLFVHDKKLFVSYGSTGNSTNNHRLVYDLVFGEWLSDEETYTSFGMDWNSQSDTGQHVLSSSRSGTLYYGDTGKNDLGKPIKFDWWSIYMDFGTPAAKHRVKRFYPFLSSEITAHTINCQVDRDYANSPTSNLVQLSAGGSLWGTAVWGSFTWGSTNFLKPRISVSGSAYRHQFRFVEVGADTNVRLLGFALYIQPLRPV